MQYIHQLTRSCVILGLLAFALVVGFSGMALADEKAAEEKAPMAEEKGEEKAKADEGQAPVAEEKGEEKAKAGEGEAPAAN